MWYSTRPSGAGREHRPSPGTSAVKPALELARIGPQLPDPLRRGVELGLERHRAREGHRVMRGQLDHALLTVDRPAHDVPPGGVTQGAEDAVVVDGDLR